MGALGPIHLVGRRRGEYPLVQNTVNKANTIFTIQIALHKNVDCLHHVDLDILAFEIFVQHSYNRRNSTGVDLLKDRATQDQLMESGVETSLELRHKTHIERDGRKQMAIAQFGRQKLHARSRRSEELTAMIP